MRESRHVISQNMRSKSYHLWFIKSQLLIKFAKSIDSHCKILNCFRHASKSLLSNFAIFLVLLSILLLTLPSHISTHDPIAVLYFKFLVRKQTNHYHLMSVSFDLYFSLVLSANAGGLYILTFDCSLLSNSVHLAKF